LLLVLEWLCCVCSQTRLGHGPRHRGRKVQWCGKSGPSLGQPKAGGSEYLELHGAFSIALRAPGAELLSKVWSPCWARKRVKLFSGAALRAGTGPLWRVAEDAHLRPQPGRHPPCTRMSCRRSDQRQDLRPRDELELGESCERRRT
jgi:hypothetical protein